MSTVVLEKLRKSFGSVNVIEEINLSIHSGEFVAFVGPSGCGKSTLLRMIAGLEEISGGALFIDGQAMNNVPPARRDIAMVFQSYALFPHLSVYENIAFGLRTRGTPKVELDRKVREAATALKLIEYLDRLPKALSGGQRQRVAIGRAMVRDPKIFLFDEPLSNLDAALRTAMRIELANLKATLTKATMIYVTHDQVEAMTLADRIVVLNKGSVEQIGTPMELYATPKNLFVARFIGSHAMNLLQAVVSGTGEETELTLPEGSVLKVPIWTRPRDIGAAITIGLRPEDLSAASPEKGLIEGTVELVEQLGEATMIHARVPCGGSPFIVAKLKGGQNYSRGTQIHFECPVNAMHFFDVTGKSWEYRTETQIH